MESSIEKYKSRLTEVPELDDAWFRPALSRARAGDEDEARRICGSSLSLALSLAEEFVAENSDAELLDVVQDANDLLVNAIARFEGDCVLDFRKFASAHIAYHLRPHLLN